MWDSRPWLIKTTMLKPLPEGLQHERWRRHRNALARDQTDTIAHGPADADHLFDLIAYDRVYTAEFLSPRLLPARGLFSAPWSTSSPATRRTKDDLLPSCVCATSEQASSLAQAPFACWLLLELTA
jgi:hypothetical protein